MIDVGAGAAVLDPLCLSFSLIYINTYRFAVKISNLVTVWRLSKLMSSFTLTDHQKTFFETFGYLVFPGLMSDCIDELTQAFHEVFERRGLTHGGQERTAMIRFIDDHERLCTLLDDSRIDGIAKGLLGDDSTPTSSLLPPVGPAM